MQATAAGSKEQDAVNALEKKFKAGGALNTDETIRLAISVMQGILTSDFKASEIEMSIVRAHSLTS
jgi:20S proteasome subunit alpha 1